MGSHIVAKEKIKGLTERLEKSLYQMKYSDRIPNVMDDKLYDKIKSICKDKYTFPLIRVYDKIYLDSQISNIYCTLTMLADNYDIIIDLEKMY